MSNIRKEILSKAIEDHPFMGLSEEQEKIAFNAMDEYMRQTCLELLEYMANKNINIVHTKQGARYIFEDELLTREQLFEIFL